ncbi:BMP family ABC transporter substrate-binding protein [Thalassobacillus sp. CUG 92003]|uniref:BMP family ABC transporter substrate-binding protein n=1 Tax=Thalassobacillus sp. CUG 92003 TaxID=2736641 RepID=UPI002105C913|nr:BMP family ABC transporter substrate-binding protein [Thalassobacillus sp. CUG 92003]
MKNYFIVCAVALAIMTGCSKSSGEGEVQSVGMLVESTIHDQAWGEQGYQGLLNIKEEYGVSVYFKEGIKNQQQTNKAVKEFVDNGVNVVFGHSSTYGNHFKELEQVYPEVHFIYFNGGYSSDNVSSVNFTGTAMGFFGGMVAGGMSQKDHVGLIAAYEWQPEVEGFYEGVKYQNPDAQVDISFVNNWDNTEKALIHYRNMEENGADVIYPAGDSFNIPVIHEVQEDGHFAIGYVSDQAALGERTVLTSTVQHVDKVYLLIMKKIVNDNLPGSTMDFGFQQDAISMGQFSPEVPKELEQKVDEAVSTYKQTGDLPIGQ